MEKVNIFSREVSWFDSLYATESPSTYSLEELFFDKSELIEKLVDKYRENKSKDEKLKLPCFTPSGIFNSRNNNGLISHNGVICMDIDKKDNEDVTNFDNIPELMEKIPYVAYCGYSCGGEGYFVLLPIAYPEKHKEHFLSICDDFERCNITVDKACINVSRTRTISYDHDAYVNEEAQVYTRVKDVVYEYEPSSNNSDRRQCYIIAKRKKMINMSWIDGKNYFKAKDIISWINAQKIDITINEYQWYKIGVSLADEFGEFGRGIFHEVSKYYPKYNKSETNKKFNHCLSQFGIHFGTFIYYAMENGYKGF